MAVKRQSIEGRITMKIKKMSLATKYMILMCALLAAVNLVMGFVLVGQTKTALKTQINARMLDVARTAAAALDGDKLASVTASDTYGELYDEIASTLRLFMDNTELTYIYTIQDMGNEQFGFIIDVDPDDPGMFGEDVVTTEALINASHGEADVDDKAFQDRWGSFYSAYAPVYDSKGNIAGMVGVDFDALWYEQQITRYNVSIIVISIAAVVIGAILVVAIVSRIITRFRKLYSELSDLSEDIEELNRDIAQNQDFTELVDEIGVKDDSADAIDEAELSVDAIGALSAKLKSMHSQMHHYLEVVHKIANTDTMTGVGNRNAYNNMIKATNAQIRESRAAYTIFITEIRQLNNIYDNLGREYGEMVISDIVGILKKNFGNENLYRIGDGEFVAVLNDVVSADRTERISREFDSDLLDYSSQLDDITLSVSKGTAGYDPVIDREYRDTFKRAENSKIY